MSNGYNSIYHKTCPQCASVVAQSAAACDCGFSFVDADKASPLAQALEDEKLYEDYLAARALQTAQTAVALKSEAAVAEAEQARAELAAQSARVAELTRQLTQQAPLPAAPTPQRNIAPLHAVPAPEFQFPVAQTVSPQESVRPQPAPRNDAPVKVKAVARTESAAAPAAPNPPVTIAEPTRIIRAPLSSRAEEVASAAQALKNELTRLRQTAPAKAAVAAPATTPAKAAAPVRAATKQCVNCNVAVPEAATRCGCGFSFVDGRVQTRAAAPAPDTDVKKILQRAKADKKARNEAAQAAKAERIRRARAERDAQRASAAPVSDQGIAPSVAAPASVTPPAQAVAASDDKSQRMVSARALVADAGAEVEANMAARAHQVVTKLNPARTRECPNCTASVAESVGKCKCGFEFADVTAINPMPALVLDAGDAVKVRDLSPRRR